MHEGWPLNSGLIVNDQIHCSACRFLTLLFACKCSQLQASYRLIMNQTFNGTLTFWVIWWINNLNFIHQTELGEYLQKFNLKFRKAAKYSWSSLSTTATLGTEESGPCKEAAIVQRFKTRVNVWSFCPLGRKKVAVLERWLSGTLTATSPRYWGTLNKF